MCVFENIITDFVCTCQFDRRANIAQRAKDFDAFQVPRRWMRDSVHFMIITGTISARFNDPLRYNKNEHSMKLTNPFGTCFFVPELLYRI